jgi:serine/threonine protein kinase
MATLTGTTLGKYQVLERLGRGGMADVYRAHHTRLDRDVAIKVLHPHLIEGQDFLARFEREAKAVASLKHPHIVQVFDFDSQDDLNYLVMELIDGGSLRGRLEELAQAGKRLPYGDTLRIFGHVASALDYAHRRGMLHRDVKPANVLLQKDGDAYLSDFGIARILSQTQFTTTGALIGTPQYMSPEQGKGLPLTEAADLYSLGVVLYEMLTGRPPYDGDTPLGVIHKHLFDPLPAPCTVCPDLPAQVDDLLFKALAKEAGERYASGAEMLEALKRALAPGAAVPVARPALQESKPKVRPPKHVLSETLRDARPATAPAEPAPEQLAISSMPTMAMEEELAASSRTLSAAPKAAAGGRPPEAHKHGMPRWGWILLGVATVTVVGVALAFGLPRVVGGLSFVPGGSEASLTPKITQRSEVSRTPTASGGCITVTDCLALAEAAAHAGHQAEAVEAYTRAQSLVPQDRQPAYAYLWCEMAKANAALDQQKQAVSNLLKCIDWTQGEPTGLDLRTQAEEQISVLLAGTFADRVLNYGPSADVNRNCANPASALGPPDFDPNNASTYLCLGVKGVVELEYTNNVPVDGPGPDIKVHGDPWNDDSWHVDVSADGDTWLHFGPQPEVVELDLAETGLERIRFIRFTDTGTGNNGAELDAVEALNWEPAG